MQIAAYPSRVDCAGAFAVFPNNRVLVSGRWRAPYHFDYVPATDLDMIEVALGKRQVTRPIGLRPMSGSLAADLMGTTWAVVNLMSDSLTRLLSSAAPEGWYPFPVELQLRGGEPLTGYHGLSITGRTGPIRQDLSVDAILPPVPGGQAVPGMRGWCFDPQSWDGSDVFSPEGAAAFCVTEAVADVLLTSGLTGMRIERMSEIEEVR